MSMTRWLLLALTGALAANLVFAQSPAPPLAFEDQFGRTAGTADLRGAVVVLVYGDRKGTEACRVLGERLHVAFHPSAIGLAPAKAQKAPVEPLPGSPPGRPGPDVCVVPVACCGKVPGPVKGLIRTQVAKSSPDVVLWLDFQNTMKDMFGVKPGDANLVVLDAAGKVRRVVNGAPDPGEMSKLLRQVQDLRAEAFNGR